jgi:hypothetical protein
MPGRANSRSTDAARNTTRNLSLIGVGGAGPGASLDEQSMQDALAKGLARKLPKRVLFGEEPPLNA